VDDCFIMHQSYVVSERRNYRVKVIFFTLTLSVILALFPGLAIAGTAGLDVAPGASLGIASSSVTFTQIGLTGEITSDIITSDLDGDGVEEVILGTSKGLYVISDGELRHFIPTSSFVMDVVVLDDITGDGQAEIAISVGDIYFPNIRCYDSATTTQLWQFAPRQEVFIENLMWTDLQTFTYDLESVDINSDGFKDLVATSGYFIYYTPLMVEQVMRYGSSRLSIMCGTRLLYPIWTEILSLTLPLEARLGICMF